MIGRGQVTQGGHRRRTNRRQRAAQPGDGERLRALAGAVRRHEDAVAGRTPYNERLRLEAEKWRLIHDCVRDAPFSTDERLTPSAQWRQAVDYARALHEIELLDWVLQQVEIAAHHEAGIRDLRPRGSGPCHPLLLRHVANRARKADLVLTWALESDDALHPTDVDTHNKVVPGRGTDRPL